MVNNPTSSYYRVCEYHFNEQDILTTPIRKILKKIALPSLNLLDLQRAVQEGPQKEDKETQVVLIGVDNNTQTEIAVNERLDTNHSFSPAFYKKTKIKPSFGKIVSIQAAWSYHKGKEEEELSKGDDMTVWLVCPEVTELKLAPVSSNRYLDMFDSTRKHWLCLECATRISNILTFIDKVVKVDAELQKIIGKLKNGEKVSLQHVSNASKLCKFPKLGSSNITSVDLETSAPHQQWLSSNMLMEYFDVDQMLIKDESKIDAYDDALDHNDGFYDDDDDVFKAAERNIDESIMDLNIGGIKIEDDDSDYYPLSTKRYKSSKSFEPKLEDDEYNGINSDKVITITLSLEEQIAEHEQLKLEKFSVEAPYRCNLCFKGFSYEETYNSHLSTHNEGYGEFKCAICHKYLKARNSYQSHMLNHSKKYKCRLCDYTRTWRTLVLEHYSVVHEKKSDVSFCDLCGKQFKKKSLLKHHLRNSHRAVKRLNCDHCQKTFKSFYTLRQHMATQHLRNRPENEKRFPCSVCGDRFRTKTCLRIHQVKHSTDRNYYCVECDMYFKTKMILKAHMKKTAKHIDPETLVSCPHCPYRSINEKELTAHIERIHLLITNFQCSMCPRAFYAGNSLRRHHRKVHEGIKAPRLHVCDVCGKAFPVRRMLTSHSNIHTGEKPYACTECDAKFAGSGALYTHVQLVHRKLKRDAQGRFKVKPDAQEEPNNKLQPVPT